MVCNIVGLFCPVEKMVDLLTVLKASCLCHAVLAGTQCPGQSNYSASGDGPTPQRGKKKWNWHHMMYKDLANQW